MSWWSIAYFTVLTYLLCVYVLGFEKPQGSAKLPGSHTILKATANAFIWARSGMARTIGAPFIVGPDSDLVTIRRWRLLRFIHVISVYFLLPGGVNVEIVRHKRKFGSKRAQLYAHRIHLYHCVLWESSEADCPTHLPVWQEAVRRRREAISELENS